MIISHSNTINSRIYLINGIIPFSDGLSIFYLGGCITQSRLVIQSHLYGKVFEGSFIKHTVSISVSCLKCSLSLSIYFGFVCWISHCFSVHLHSFCLNFRGLCHELSHSCLEEGKEFSLCCF